MRDTRSVCRRNVIACELLFVYSIVAFASAGAAQKHAFFHNGDIIAGAQTLAIIEAFGRYDWFLPDGSLNKRFAAPFAEFPFDFAVGPDGRLYSPSFFTVRIFDATGTFVGNFPRFL